MDEAKPTRRAFPGLGLLVAVPAVLVVELIGLLLVGGIAASALAGVVGRGFFLAIGFGVLWFAGGGAALSRLTRGRGALRPVTRITWLSTALLAAAFFAWTSFRDTTVHEVVATGVPASSLPTPTATSAPGGAPVAATAAPSVDVQLVSGQFHSLDESASGTAAVVRLAHGGRVLTLTQFASSNGPDVRVYLVAGQVLRGADLRDKVDLGGLKGNRGDQQYAIPDDVDIGRFSTVVIYCRSFHVAFGAAEMRAS